MADGQSKKAVLVLEDAVAIRALVRAILDGAGYSVLEAGTVEEAARQMRAVPEPPRALICDVNIPDDNPLAGVVRLREIQPELKVLYMSGEDIGTALPVGSAFIQKPFAPDALVKKLDRLLAG